MAITYTWKLTSLKKKNSGSHNGVVFQTHWLKTGTDENGNTGSFSGATPFDPTQVNPENFVAFEQLTETVILGWIQSAQTIHYEQHINDQIQRQIDDKISVTADVAEGAFPWDTSEPVTPPAPAPV